MSTSVILEGLVSLAPDASWEGTWRFSKDKKGTLQFTYKKTSNEIPRDLYDYVSFLDPASINDSSLQRSIHSSKMKKRGRGRPRSNSQDLLLLSAGSGLTTGVVAVAGEMQQGDGNTIVALNAEENADSSKDVAKIEIIKPTHPIDVMSESSLAAQAVTHDVIQSNSKEQQPQQTNNEDTIYGDDDDEEEDLEHLHEETKPAAVDPIKIQEDHPLMGLWEGSFKVKNAKGSEDIVNETLFLYTTLGSADAPPEFKDLPPEPSFPFCLMKGSQWTTFLNAQLSLKGQLSTTVVNQQEISMKIDEQNLSNHDDEYRDPQRVNEEQINSSVKSDRIDEGITGLPSGGNVDVLNNATLPDNSKDTVESTAVVVDKDATLEIGTYPPSGPSDSKATSNTSSNPLSAAAFDQVCKLVLVGFGRNAIGRFSVAAVYDESTGEMRCEKKYMTVKHTIKRGRRSYAEYAMAYSDGTLAAPTPVGIKPQRRYSIDTAAAGTTDGAAADAATFSTRHRIKNSLYYPYEEDFASDAAAAALNNTNNSSSNGPPTKKKRLSGSGIPSAPLSSSSKREGSSSGHYKEGKTGKDGNHGFPNILTEDNIHHLLKLDKNILIGPRNPDNDLLLAQSAIAMMNPKSSKHATSSSSSHLTSGFATTNLAGAIFDISTGMLYRDAFMDCDSGEIYEGEWFNGHRHGRGIVLYADGLMYEGSWSKGKEHGKGDLMLSDRTIVYSGDWYEGYFHGQGTYHYPNGDVYTGDWKEGNRHGRGEYIYVNIRTPALMSPDGPITIDNAVAAVEGNTKLTRYSGDWRDNRRHGKGRFVWSDGSFYEGDWENDLRHGRGLLELSNHFKYEGSWYRNVMEGKGTCVFPSGQYYQGTFRGGLRDGRGSITFAEGAVYEGRFREDRFDGQGTLKVNQIVPGNDKDELFLPIQLQSDLWRIHWKAGFGSTHH